MAAAGDAELTLLTKLQSGDLHHIHRLISSHLLPFQTLIKPPQNPNPKSTKNPSPSLIRSLAKSHLSFLNRSLSLIPKRLSETTPKIDPQFTPELFESYKLCLQCLECISSQLSCKPYSVHLQRARMIHCMEAWEKYGEAEAEGWSVLEGLRGIYSGGKRNFKFVPGVEKEGGGDRELAFLVVEIVVTVLKCVCMKTSRGEGDYRNMLVLVEEVAPWFRYVIGYKLSVIFSTIVLMMNCIFVIISLNGGEFF